jgi:hypothetical protein
VRLALGKNMRSYLKTKAKTGWGHCSGCRVPAEQGPEFKPQYHTAADRGGWRERDKIKFLYIRVL